MSQILFSATRPEAVGALLQCHPKYKTRSVCLMWTEFSEMHFGGTLSLWSLNSELKLFRDHFFHKHSREREKGSREPASQAQSLLVKGDVNFLIYLQFFRFLFRQLKSVKSLLHRNIFRAHPP